MKRMLVTALVALFVAAGITPSAEAAPIVGYPCWIQLHNGFFSSTWGYGTEGVLQFQLRSDPSCTGVTLGSFIVTTTGATASGVNVDWARTPDELQALYQSLVTVIGSQRVRANVVSNTLPSGEQQAAYISVGL